MTREERLAKAARGARLMLYAWKGARKNMGLADDHTELNNIIAELEAALASPNHIPMKAALDASVSCIRCGQYLGEAH